MRVAALCVAAYLIGAIPFGLLVGFARGVDVRRHGSGNIGATNVGRVLGRRWGVLVFLLDAGKCLGVMSAARWTARWCGFAVPGAASSWLLFGAGLLAIAGNVAPVYLRFRGGKGVASSVGVMLGVWPELAVPGLVCLLLWVAIVKTTRYVSLASIVAALAHPLVMLAGLPLFERTIYDIYPLLLLSAILAVVIVFRHRQNIRRLLAGTEQKVRASE
ncbi:MAG: glycerol-3-phosphate 1-O-acyltransferase PlsY [Phycisphaerae bacterium]|nr:glycerol-3-phosphate 1-O-acyltransferase PlsY [Phycisphaerae bacterium]